MMDWIRRYRLWIVAGLVASALGAAGLARLQLAQLRDAFETDARIAHRLLSQRLAQNDAVLATLALLQPQAQASAPEQRLVALYPQILGVQRRDRDAAWTDARLAAAETMSRAVRRPALAGVDLAGARYQLVLAAEPASFALRMDLRATVPWNEWPMAPDTSPVRVALVHEGQHLVLQPGRIDGSGWRFDFRKPLASASQPFDMVAQQQVGWAGLPWGWMGAWSLVVAGVLALACVWLRQREERRRAEELLRLGQVARLNTLGELAAGMAHEFNQPLTALLASTQAAGRLLGEDPPDLPLARNAMAVAAQQARRAADVVGRLRRAVQAPQPAAPLQPVVLQEAVSNALYLLAPELQRRQVTGQVDAPSEAVTVQAEPVALEQIIHNLLLNALQALEQVPVGERSLRITLSAQAAHGILTVADTGPGIASDALPRLFEPFFTTRADGLGLGLNLCETLAGRMGGQLTATHQAPRGAAFQLRLPLAATQATE